MIDHVNYQVPVDVVHSVALAEFMEDLLGLRPVTPDEALDADYTVQWWQDEDGMRVHVVGAAGNALPQGLGHLCVRVGKDEWRRCSRSKWLARHNPTSPMARLWLHGPGGLRVEVQHA